MKSTIETILQFKIAGRAITSSLYWKGKLCTKRQSSSFLSALPIEWKSLTNPPTHNGRMEQNPQSDSIFPLSNQLVSSSRVKFVRKVIGKISNHFSVNRKISEISFGSFTAGRWGLGGGCGTKSIKSFDKKVFTRFNGFFFRLMAS